MTTAKQNRNSNYNAIKPELGWRQHQVHELLKSHPNGLTRQEIATHLNLPINSITGRVKELEAMHLIENSGETRLSSYGKSGVVVRVKQQPVAKAEQRYLW